MEGGSVFPFAEYSLPTSAVSLINAVLKLAQSSANSFFKSQIAHKPCCWPLAGKVHIVEDLIEGRVSCSRDSESHERHRIDFFQRHSPADVVVCRTSFHLRCFESLQVPVDIFGSKKAIMGSIPTSCLSEYQAFTAPFKDKSALR